MLTAIIDYGSGNLHSALKAFERMAGVVSSETVVVTSDPGTVKAADRIVLPGDGAFPACKNALAAQAGMMDALNDTVMHQKRPFLGICVGMQLLARAGYEYEETPGLGWVEGDVVAIEPHEAGLKVPHMGWNNLEIQRPHPLFDGLATGAHAYFVHSYHMRVTNPAQLIAQVDYGGAVTAVVGHDNILGLQFHPEKSGPDGLKMISNFLKWRP